MFSAPYYPCKPDNFTWSTLRVVWLTHRVTDQSLIGFLLNWQTSAGEIPANRGHSGISAGQWRRAWAADRGRGDDNCSWKATAGCLTASYQQVRSVQDKTAIPFTTGDIIESPLWSVGVAIHTIVLFPSRLDSAENQVDETIFLLESYINSTASTS